MPLDFDRNAEYDRIVRARTAQPRDVGMTTQPDPAPAATSGGGQPQGDPQMFQSSDISQPTIEHWRQLANQMQPSQGAYSGNLDPTSLDPSKVQTQNNAQYLRKWGLTLSGGSGGGEMNFSDFRVSFTLHKQMLGSPNRLYAKIYNLSPKTMQKMLAFTEITLSAGYRFANYGIIFKGTIVQFVRAKETPVDTYFEIHAGDGDPAHNSAVMNKAFPAGSTDQDKINEAKKNYQDAGTALGQIDQAKNQEAYARQLVEVRKTRDVWRELDLKQQRNSFFDNGVFHSLNSDSYRQGEAVVLSPKTGLVGMPEVTPQGIQAKCLLNPKLQLGGLVHIDAQFLSGVPYLPGQNIQTNGQGDPIGNPTGGTRLPVATFNEQFESAWTSPTGTYKIMAMDYSGDTRGLPWYTEITCVAIGSNGKPMLSTNPSNAYFRSSPQARGGQPIQSPGGQRAIGS